MVNWNQAAYDALDAAFAFVEALGLPLAILAWLTVFLGAVGMVPVLRAYSMRGKWVPAIGVGAATLAAHALDYCVTLQVSPTLAMEANPLWRSVIESFGLPVAKLYGMSGKLLLSILSFELSAFYLIQREKLYPAVATGLASFWRGYGDGAHRAIRWRNLTNFFCFCFGLLSPFVAYVAFLNTLVNDAVYLRMPSMPVVLVAYLVSLCALYAITTYRAFLGRDGNSVLRSQQPVVR